MLRSLGELTTLAKQGTKGRLVVAAAQDIEILEAVAEAKKFGIVDPILVGDQAQIEALAKKHFISLDGMKLIAESDPSAAAERAVQLISEGNGDFLMKGLVDTSILLKALLRKEYGLRTEALLSHVMLYQMKTYHKLLFLTDGGMNISPDIEAKTAICQNVVSVAKALGLHEVKVAALAAKEKVNNKMPATVDAAELQRLSEKGIFGDGVIVEGPLALDLAVSKQAAEVKKFDSAVAGDADVLLVPNIEMGNGIGKSMTYLAGADSAGIIVGAKIPVVLVSRADSHQVKFNSIALGAASLR